MVLKPNLTGKCSQKRSNLEEIHQKLVWQKTHWFRRYLRSLTNSSRGVFRTLLKHLLWKFLAKIVNGFSQKKSTIDVSQNPAYVSTLLNQRTSCYCDSCLWKSLKYELCNFNEKYRYFPTIFLSLLSANSTKKVNTLTQFVSFCRRIVWVCLTIL